MPADRRAPRPEDRIPRCLFGGSDLHPALLPTADLVDLAVCRSRTRELQIAVWLTPAAVYVALQKSAREGTAA
jgi:hypothetical protein